jgi:hypothetical protein
MQQYTWAYINDNIYYMYTSKRILLEDTKCNYKNKEQSIVLASNTYLEISSYFTVFALEIIIIALSSSWLITENKIWYKQATEPSD